MSASILVFYLVVNSYFSVFQTSNKSYFCVIMINVFLHPVVRPFIQNASFTVVFNFIDVCVLWEGLVYYHDSSRWYTHLYLIEVFIILKIYTHFIGVVCFFQRGKRPKPLGVGSSPWADHRFLDVYHYLINIKKF